MDAHEDLYMDDNETFYIDVLCEAKLTESMMGSVLKNEKVSELQVNNFKKFVNYYNGNLKCIESDVVSSFLDISGFLKVDKAEATTIVKKYKNTRGYLGEVFEEMKKTSEHVGQFLEKFPKVINRIFKNEIENYRKLPENAKVGSPLQKIADMPKANKHMQTIMNEYDMKNNNYIEKLQKSEIELLN